MIVDRINHWSQTTPEAVAFVWNDHAVTYRAFATAIRRERAHFESIGLPSEGLAIVSLASLRDTWIVVLALRAHGLDTLTVDSVEMASEFGALAPACIVVEEKADVAAWEAFARGARIVRASPGSFDHPGAGGRIENTFRTPGRHLLATSGTTGRRKLAALDNVTETERNLSWSKAFGFDQQSVFHGAFFPLFTGVGYLKPSALWHQGGKVILDQRANPLAGLARHGTTLLILTPALVPVLLKTFEQMPVEGRRFQLLVAGGFLSASAARQVSQFLEATVGVYYASTEIAAVTLASRVHGVDDLVWLESTGARELEVVDETGMRCAVGQTGELRIRQTRLDTPAYLGDPEASAAVFRDGFFHPGDMAVRREDGRIRVLGRTSDVLNVKGVKLPVAPVEQRIQALLGADEVCVFAGLAADGIDEAVVAVRTSRKITKEEAQAVRGVLQVFQRVRLRVMPDFPRSPTGLKKTQRRALRQMLIS